MTIVDPLEAKTTDNFPESNVDDFINYNPGIFDVTDDYYIGRAFEYGTIKPDKKFGKIFDSQFENSFATI